MSATSPTYRPATDMGWLTTTSLAMIAVFAAITLVAILYGMRLAAKRRAARLIEEDRVEAEAPPAPEPSAESVAEPVAPELARAETPPVAPEPLPVAPSPSPLEPVRIAGTPAADPLPAAPDLTDEPLAAAATPGASPAVEAESAPSASPAGDRPLTTLKGLGPKVAARLEELGIATVGDLAALDDAQAQAVDARLGPFTGRMARDRWLDQARLLTAGDDRGFEAQFGRL